MIIEINNYDTWDDSKFKATIDLKTICENTGKWVKDYDPETGRLIRYSPYPVSRCRALFKLIKLNTDENEQKKIESYLKNHSTKCFEIWQKVK